MLPRGSEEGKPYQFFFVVYPYEHKDIHESYQNPFSRIPIDVHPALYPLNRPILFEKIWETLPNVLFHEEKIYFKDVYDLKLPRITRA